MILTPLLRDMLVRVGLVDQPDLIRKRHRHPTPRFGGVAIAAAYLAAFGSLLLLPLKASDLIWPELPAVWALMPAVGLIFLTGLADDLYGLRPRHKLLGQFGAAALACAAGVDIMAGPGGAHTWYSIPMTLLWLVGCSNAFNLIDGLDGLAAGIGIFATLAMVIASLLNNNVTLALLTAPLLGSLLGFLRYNFSPASIFLGDSGSLLIGFLIGCFGVRWGHESPGSLGMVAPVMAVFVPLLDTALSIARRFARNRPIFEGDYGHIHHRLLAQGMAPAHVTLLLYAAAGLAAGLSLLQSYVHANFTIWVMLVFTAATTIFVWNLGYPEFPAAWRLLRRGTRLRHNLNAQILLRSLEESLARAKTPQECWSAVAETAGHFDFCSIHLNVDGEQFETHWRSPKPGQVWQIQVPLSESSYLKMEREFGTAVSSSVICTFVDSLRDHLGQRVPEFEGNGFSTLPPNALSNLAPNALSTLAPRERLVAQELKAQSKKAAV